MVAIVSDCDAISVRTEFLSCGEFNPLITYTEQQLNGCLAFHFTKWDSRILQSFRKVIIFTDVSKFDFIKDGYDPRRLLVFDTVNRSPWDLHVDIVNVIKALKKVK